MTGAIACAMLSIGCSKSSGSSSGSGSGPKVTAVNPSSGRDSTIVTIMGTGFSATVADDNVSFNGKQAVVIGASTTQIQAMVPTLAGTGALTITVYGLTITAGTFSYDTSWSVTPIIHNLNAPYSLSIDADGTLYLGCYTGYLTKINPQGGSNVFAYLGAVTASAMDAAGNLYVSTLVGGDSSSIVKLGPAGNNSIFATDSGRISGLAFDAGSGNLYAANSSKSTVEKISPQGLISVLAGDLNDPSGITATADGTVYVNNYSSPGYSSANGVVTKITSSGAVSTLVAIGKYDANSGMTNDGTSLYLTVFDQGPAVSSIVKITPSGTVSTLVTGNGVSAPDAITRDGKGNLYVSNFLDTIAAGATTGSVVKLTMH